MRLWAKSNCDLKFIERILTFSYKNLNGQISTELWKITSFFYTIISDLGVSHFLVPLNSFFSFKMSSHSHLLGEIRIVTFGYIRFIREFCSTCQRIYRCFATSSRKEIVAEKWCCVKPSREIENISEILIKFW